MIAIIFAHKQREQYPFMHKCKSTLNTLSSIAHDQHQQYPYMHKCKSTLKNFTFSHAILSCIYNLSADILYWLLISTQG